MENETMKKDVTLRGLSPAGPVIAGQRQVLRGITGCPAAAPGKGAKSHAPDTPGADFSSRGKRRGGVRDVIAYLSAIKGAEQKALDNVPGNFRCSDSYEAGEAAVDALDEAIDLLSDVY
jgi:hypothetical protein